MDTTLLKEFFDSAPDALSYHKAIYDDFGVAIDFEILGVNVTFEKLFEASINDIKGKRFSRLFPIIKGNKSKLLKTCNNVLIKNKSEKIDLYFDIINKWFNVTIFPLRESVIGVILREKASNDISVAERLSSETAISEQLFDEDIFLGTVGADVFNKNVADAIVRADSYKEPLSMVLFKLDNFNSIFKKVGSEVGNEMLAQTIDITKGIIRKYDVISRISENKIALLMPKTNAEGATAVAERLKLAFENNVHPIVGEVTASFGVAEKLRDESFKTWNERLGKALTTAITSGDKQIITSVHTDADVLNLQPIVWSSEWECGNEIIDGQHKEILLIANEIIEGYNSGLDMKQIDELLHELFLVLVKHFKIEDEILEEMQYPEFEKHADISKNLLGKAFELKGGYELGDITLTEFLKFIFNDVVLGHMLEEDVEFFFYVKKSLRKT